LYYILSLISYFILLIGQTLWVAWLNPNTLAPKSLVIFIIIVPLLLPIRGLLHGKLKTYKGMTLFIWLYFIYGFWNMAEHTQRPLGALQIISSVVFFIFCVLYVRQQRVKTIE